MFLPVAHCLREFGRTTVILTTGAGNVGAQLRAGFQFRFRIGKSADLLYIYMCKIGLGDYLFAKTNIKQWFLMLRLEKPEENQCFWEASEPGFSDFSDFPQMENRGLRWIALGLGSPKTLFSVKKPWFLSYFWQFPIIWGFPLGPPVGPYWLLSAPIGSY